MIGYILLIVFFIVLTLYVMEYIDDNISMSDSTALYVTMTSIQTGYSDSNHTGF